VFYEPHHTVSDVSDHESVTRCGNGKECRCKIAVLALKLVGSLRQASLEMVNNVSSRLERIITVRKVMEAIDQQLTTIVDYRLRPELRVRR